MFIRPILISIAAISLNQFVLGNVSTIVGPEGKDYEALIIHNNSDISVISQVINYAEKPIHIKHVLKLSCQLDGVTCSLIFVKGVNNGCLTDASQISPAQCYYETKVGTSVMQIASDKSNSPSYIKINYQFNKNLFDALKSARNDFPDQISLKEDQVRVPGTEKEYVSVESYQLAITGGHIECQSFNLKGAKNRCYFKIDSATNPLP